MQKEYVIKNIHCADCARVLAEAISKVDGVLVANINFVRQKFNLEIDDTKDFAEVFERVMKIIKDFSSKVVVEEITKSTLSKSYSFIYPFPQRSDVLAIVAFFWNSFIKFLSMIQSLYLYKYIFTKEKKGEII